jgi:hypothetical protein
MYKFGVVYAHSGQTSLIDMLGNSTMSRAFEDFLALLGTRVSLLNFDKFNGLLDCSPCKSC